MPMLGQRGDEGRDEAVVRGSADISDDAPVADYLVTVTSHADAGQAEPGDQIDSLAERADRLAVLERLGDEVHRVADLAQGLGGCLAAG
jgi:hypothetical protein